MLIALERNPHPSDTDLQDMGLMRSDYDTLAAAPKGSRERMVFMAERFGISEKQLDEEHWRVVEMARTCAKCGVAANCERFRKGKNTTFGPTDCPNASQFSEISN
jgi:hypothetical protein